MQLLKTFAFVLAAISLSFVLPAAAQDADVDQARALLDRGQEQFNAMEYAEAKATLLSIDPDDLPGDDAVKALESLLSKADQALVQQQAGQEAYIQGQELLNSGEFNPAAAKFQAVLDNDYVHPAMKKDAKSMLSLADAKAKRAAEMKAAADAKAAEEKAAAEAKAAADAKAAEEKAAAEAKAAADAKAAEEKAAAEAKAVADAKAAEEKAAAEAKAAAEKDAVDLAAVVAQAKRIRAQADTRKYIELGNDYLDAGVPDKALEAFRQALTITPDSADAEKGFQRAQAQLDAGVSETSSLQKLLDRRAIALQEAKAKYDAAMADAAAILEKANLAGDFTAAGERARFAMSIIQSSKQLFPTEEFNVRMARAQDLLDRITEREQAWRALQLQLARQQATQKAAEYEAEQRRQRDMKISTLKDSVRQLEQARKWEQAIATAEEILRLDPHSAWASSRLELLRTYRTAFDERDAYKERLNQEQLHSAAIAWDSIPWYDLLRFPKDWAEITRRRGATTDGSESAADRAVRLKLEEIQPVFDFPDMELGEIIEFIRTAADVNITVNWTELESAGVAPETAVTLKLSNVSTARALEEILASVGGIYPLGYVIKDGVVRISTKTDLATIVDTVVYDIKDILFTTPNFEGPLLSVSSEDVSDGGGGDSEDLFDSGGTDNATEDAADDRLAAITNLLTTVQASIDPASWQDQGGVGSIRELNGMIIVTQTPDNHRRIASLLDELRDSESVQINIEARYITVSTGFLNDIGLTLNFFLNTGSTTTSTGTVDPITGASIVTPGNANGQLPQWQGTTSTSDRFTPIGMIQNSASFTAGNSTGVPNSIGGAAAGIQALSLAGTFLDDIQVDFLLRATQADQRSSSFLAPRLTLSNGQRAYVAITQEQAYVSDLEPVTDENVSAYDPTITRLSTGNTLDVEAVASADRRYVTMTLRPSLASLVDFFEYAINQTTGANTSSAEGIIQLPITSQTRYRATVKVPDGGTLLVAGERRAGESTREMGTPILNKIPIINRLFSNRSMVRDEYMTIMLIKPTIIISKEYETYELPN